MAKDGKTQNIYSSWYETLKNKRLGAALKPIRSLESFSNEEINHLIWLLQQRLGAIDVEKSVKSDN